MSQVKGKVSDRRTADYLEMSSPPTDGWLFAQAILGNPVRILQAPQKRDSDTDRFAEAIAERCSTRLPATKYLVVSESYFFSQAILGKPIDEAILSATDVTAARAITEAVWDPTVHPRGGFPQNPGWFSTTAGG